MHFKSGLNVEFHYKNIHIFRCAHTQHINIHLSDVAYENKELHSCGDPNLTQRIYIHHRTGTPLLNNFSTIDLRP